MTFLQQRKLKPPRIVHGAADQKIAAMDKDVVEIQHRYFFGEVLSDAQAKALK